jgi:hypothetical protein
MLTMTNHFASLTVQQLQKSHEHHWPLRAKADAKHEPFGSGDWNEEEEC